MFPKILMKITDLRSISAKGASRLPHPPARWAGRPDRLLHVAFLETLGFNAGRLTVGACYHFGIHFSLTKRSRVPPLKPHTLAHAVILADYENSFTVSCDLRD